MSTMQIVRRCKLTQLIFPILGRMFTSRRICGGTLGLLLLLMFYVQTVQIGADCPFWAVCQIESELREVELLPAVQPDRCVRTATMYKGIKVGNRSDFLLLYLQVPRPRYVSSL